MMSTPVMFVLSALLVAMVTCSGHEEADSNYVDNGMDGTWYIMGKATNNWTAFDRTKVTTVVVTPTATGLSAKFSERTSSSDASCTTTDTLHFDKEEGETGVFEYTSNNKEYIVVVKQFNATKGYAVIHTAVHDHADDGVDSQAAHDCINELYSRTTTMTQAVMDEFERVSFADDAIPAAKVKFMADNGECGP